ncbi:MAG: DNA-processing protein DprA [Bacteroidota bacterium]|nr:DNA-processing protein DprA [Bacteroidota bacterium]
MQEENLRHVLAALMVPKIGPVMAKQLIAYCGSPEAIFRQKKGHLQKIPGIGSKLADSIVSFKDFDRVDKEFEFVKKHKIQVHYFLDPGYPHRLKEIADAPVLLFYRGNADLNASKMLAVVGTRKNTDYGKAHTERLIEALAPLGVTIISGLAYGIDYYAHKAALENGLPTIGVVGHGLDIIYPATHRSMAAKMVEQGGLLTEYPSGVQPDRQHFPARNRIVAGLVDGVVLVETGIKGGALITADVANSYDREVFAFPGRTNDEYSAGCNHFIKVNKAFLVEGAEDVVYYMGWEQDKVKTKISKSFANLSPEEMKVVGLLKETNKLDIDQLCEMTGDTISQISVLLLDMEFKGIIQALPGKGYRIAQ